LLDEDIEDEKETKPQGLADCNFDISPNKITDNKEDDLKNLPTNNFDDQEEDMSYKGRS